MRIATSSRHRDHGFTLTEVVIIALILGIFSTLSINTAQREWEREQVNSTAIGLAGWLDQVRRSALRGQGCTASIGSGTGTFSPGTSLATSSVITGSSTQIDEGNACLTNSPFLTPGIGTRPAFTIDSTSITFTPRGSVIMPSDPTDIVISLANSGVARCVRISGLIGSIDISKGSTCGNQERF